MFPPAPDRKYKIHQHSHSSFSFYPLLRVSSTFFRIGNWWYLLLWSLLSATVAFFGIPRAMLPPYLNMSFKHPSGVHLSYQNDAFSPFLTSTPYSLLAISLYFRIFLNPTGYYPSPTRENPFLLDRSSFIFAMKAQVREQTLLEGRSRFSSSKVEGEFIRYKDYPWLVTILNLLDIICGCRSLKMLRKVWKPSKKLL